LIFQRLIITKKRPKYEIMFSFKRSLLSFVWPFRLYRIAFG